MSFSVGLSSDLFESSVVVHLVVFLVRLIYRLIGRKPSTTIDYPSWTCQPSHSYSAPARPVSPSTGRFSASDEPGPPSDERRVRRRTRSSPSTSRRTSPIRVDADPITRWSSNFRRSWSWRLCPTVHAFSAPTATDDHARRFSLPWTHHHRHLILHPPSPLCSSATAIDIFAFCGRSGADPPRASEDPDVAVCAPLAADGARGDNHSAHPYLAPSPHAAFPALRDWEGRDREEAGLGDPQADTRRCAPPGRRHQRVGDGDSQGCSRNRRRCAREEVRGGRVLEGYGKVGQTEEERCRRSGTVRGGRRRPTGAKREERGGGGQLILQPNVYELHDRTTCACALVSGICLRRSHHIASGRSQSASRAFPSPIVSHCFDRRSSSRLGRSEQKGVHPTRPSQRGGDRLGSRAGSRCHPLLTAIKPPATLPQISFLAHK